MSFGCCSGPIAALRTDLGKLRVPFQPHLVVTLLILGDGVCVAIGWSILGRAASGFGAVDHEPSATKMDQFALECRRFGPLSMVAALPSWSSTGDRSPFFDNFRCLCLR